MKFNLFDCLFPSLSFLLSAGKSKLEEIKENNFKLSKNEKEYKKLLENDKLQIN